MKQKDFTEEPIKEKALAKTDKQEVVTPLNDDGLIVVAEQAEKRIAAMKKIKACALQMTNSNDWIDEGGKPYLQVSGSEKVARLFGISWRVSEPTFEVGEDGHYMYCYKGEFMMKGALIEAVGTRSSRDAFFSRKSEWKTEDGQKVKKKVDIPPEKIDKANVMKGAYTNCIGNGITRLLGIRNLTWEELTAVGIKAATKVEFKSKCSECKADITSAEKGYSEKKYQKALCRDCQAKQNGGGK